MREKEYAGTRLTRRILIVDGWRRGGGVLVGEVSGFTVSVGFRFRVNTSLKNMIMASGEMLSVRKINRGSRLSIIVYEILVNLFAG